MQFNTEINRKKTTPLIVWKETIVCFTVNPQRNKPFEQPFRAMRVFMVLYTVKYISELQKPADH